jgi:Carboxypeptidase regulatory-like domain
MHFNQDRQQADGDCPMRSHFPRFPGIACLALLLTACGGGSSGGQPTVDPLPPAVSAPAAVGSIAVEVSGPAGEPLGGVSVSLNGGFNGREAKTGADGRLVFKDVPVGEASLAVFQPGYFSAYVRPVVVSRNTLTSSAIRLERLTAATAVLLAARPTLAALGHSLSVEVDFVLLDERGQAIETLTESSVTAPQPDCGFGYCILSRDGGYYSYEMARLGGFTLLPAQNRRPIAAAVLMEQSEPAAVGDPSGLRYTAIGAFFDSITAPDAAALASYRGDQDVPALTPHSEFTSDGARLRGALDAMKEPGRGTDPPTLTAVNEMLAYTAANAPSGPGERQRAVVVVSPDSKSRECAGWPSAACLAAVAQASETSLKTGVPVVALASGGGMLQNLAVRTGGAYVYMVEPVQLPVVSRALASIVGRSLPFNRVRLELNRYGSEVFASGDTVWVGLQIDVRPGIRFWMDISSTIP